VTIACPRVLGFSDWPARDSVSLKLQQLRSSESFLADERCASACTVRANKCNFI